MLVLMRKPSDYGFIHLRSQELVPLIQTHRVIGNVGCRLKCGRDLVDGVVSRTYRAGHDVKPTRQNRLEKSEIAAMVAPLIVYV